MKSESFSDQSNPGETANLPAGVPRYFHLLWEEELDSLRGVLESLRRHRHEVLARWHQLYLLHFGDLRSLAESEFLELFGQELDATLADLLGKDMDRFTADVRAIGERLAERRVPFAELIVSMHLFEESASEYFPTFPPTLPKTYLCFDKLSHCRMIVLADAYFRSQSALVGTRIKELEREAARLPVDQRSRFHGLVGASPGMRDLYQRIEAAGATRGTVLIVGESGTGKELVARAVHECGSRSDASFVALNCAAVPKDLIESELFGHTRGSFSGATTEYLGLFRAAEGGSLFLDEVTEMSPETQSKLLRAIQERSVRPVGSTRERPVNARLIASTNRDPEQAVRDGDLREDLYYRLQASVISVPPLRERLEDVPLLVEHFIALFNERMLRPAPVVGMEEDAVTAMRRYRWPGNVRELANAVESAFTFGRSPTIRLADLPPVIARPGPAQSQARSPAARSAFQTFAEAERDLIANALEATGGNKLRAAKMLKISRKKLYAKIAKYGLTKSL
jgi:two-component system, NtrC family, response regulator AtoC